LPGLPATESRRVSRSVNCGRLWAGGGGKSRIAAAIACYIATYMDHRKRLAPGEVGTVLVLAATRDQAGRVFDYVKAFLESSPVLRQQIESMTATAIS
jgi:phage terminase large subunit-like protein